MGIKQKLKNIGEFLSRLFSKRPTDVDKQQKKIELRVVREIDDEEKFLAAVRSDNLNEVKRLIGINQALVSVKNKAGDYPLHVAARAGALEVVKYLTEKKSADINAKNEDENTPLHLAAYIGNVDIVEYLIVKGANTNAENKLNETPLHWAAGEGHLEVVKLLMDKKANVEAKDKAGITPLLLALEGAREPQHTEIAKLLMPKDDKEKKEKLKTLLHFASEKRFLNAIKNIIKNHGVSLDAKDEQDAKVILLLKSEKASNWKVSLVRDLDSKLPWHAWILLEEADAEWKPTKMKVRYELRTRGNSERAQITINRIGNFDDIIEALWQKGGKKEKITKEMVGYLECFVSLLSESKLEAESKANVLKFLKASSKSQVLKLEKIGETLEKFLGSEDNENIFFSVESKKEGQGKAAREKKYELSKKDLELVYHIIEAQQNRENLLSVFIEVSKRIRTDEHLLNKFVQFGWLTPEQVKRFQELIANKFYVKNPSQLEITKNLGSEIAKAAKDVQENSLWTDELLAYAGDPNKQIPKLDYYVMSGVDYVTQKAEINKNKGKFILLYKETGEEGEEKKRQWYFLEKDGRFTEIKESDAEPEFKFLVDVLGNKTSEDAKKEENKEAIQNAIASFLDSYHKVKLEIGTVSYESAAKIHKAAVRDLYEPPLYSNTGVKFGLFPPPIEEGNENKNWESCFTWSEKIIREGVRDGQFSKALAGTKWKGWTGKIKIPFLMNTRLPDLVLQDKKLKEDIDKYNKKKFFGKVIALVSLWGKIFFSYMQKDSNNKAIDKKVKKYNAANIIQALFSAIEKGGIEVDKRRKNEAFKDMKSIIALIQKFDKNFKAENFVDVASGFTLLHWAVIKGNGKAVKWFIEKGARLDVKDNEGRTPLDLAIELDDIEILKIIKPFLLAKELQNAENDYEKKLGEALAFVGEGENKADKEAEQLQEKIGDLRLELQKAAEVYRKAGKEIPEFISSVLREKIITHEEMTEQEKEKEEEEDLKRRLSVLRGEEEEEPSKEPVSGGNKVVSEVTPIKPPPEKFVPAEKDALGKQLAEEYRKSIIERVCEKLKYEILSRDGGYTLQSKLDKTILKIEERPRGTRLYTAPDAPLDEGFSKIAKFLAVEHEMRELGKNLKETTITIHEVRPPTEEARKACEKAFKVYFKTVEFSFEKVTAPQPLPSMKV